MFTYLLKTTCTVNGKIYWGTHQSNDLLFDLPRNQSVAWPQNKAFVDDYRQYGPNAFYHQVITAFPAADTNAIDKALTNAINGTPKPLRYNVKELTQEQLEKLRNANAEFTYITNGKETKRVKKLEELPKGWVIGNGNLMSGKERAELRLKLRQEKTKIGGGDVNDRYKQVSIDVNSAEQSSVVEPLSEKSVPPTI